ncbi:MAG: ComF family protein [Pseudomonadota bacterium]|nr:ComF family protein [Pseudomonadota bacterium]
MSTKIWPAWFTTPPSLLDTLLSLHCRCCDVALAHSQLCRACEEGLPWNRTACGHCALPMQTSGICPRCLRRPPGFDSAFAAFRLGAPVLHGVHALKYHAVFSQSNWLGALMARQLDQRGAELPQLLIPVPLNPLRLMRRGYNQAAEIGRHFETQLGLKMDVTNATRLRQIDDQIGQSLSARRRNMRGAFAVNGDLTGMHVALIDDVMTPGATLNELARACRRAGAAHIEAWAVARTP